MVTNHVTGYNVENCEELWSKTFGNQLAPKGSYHSSNAGSFWVAAWLENGENESGFSTSSGDIYLMRIGYDGSTGGSSGVESLASPESGFGDWSRVSGGVHFERPVTVYDLQGRRVATGTDVSAEPGIYIATDNSGNKVKFNINR